MGVGITLRQAFRNVTHTIGWAWMWVFHCVLTLRIIGLDEFLTSHGWKRVPGLWRYERANE